MAMNNVCNKVFIFVGSAVLALLVFILFVQEEEDSPIDTMEIKNSNVIITAAGAVRGWRSVSVARDDAIEYGMPTNVLMQRSWSDGEHSPNFFWVDFGDWTFPFGGTNEFSHLVVSTKGEVYFEGDDASRKIAAVGDGEVMTVVPGVSRFWMAEGKDDTRILTWEKFALKSDTSVIVSAQIVLRANGDFRTSFGGVVRSFERVEAFDWDGDGIANEDDANPFYWDGHHFGQTQGQKDFVARMVGCGLRNGYFRFRATFAKAPRKRTLLRVGTNRVVVVEAGNYDFLLEKGREYTFGTQPFMPTVNYTAVDDISQEE